MGKTKAKAGVSTSSGQSSPLASPRRLSRLTEQKEADPEAFRAQFSGALSRTNSTEEQPIAHALDPGRDAFKLAAPAGVKGTETPLSPAATCGGLEDDRRGRQPSNAVLGKALAVSVSHTGRNLVAESVARKNLRFKRVMAGAAFVRAAAAAGEETFEGDRPEKFPLVFERRHINKWLVAEHSGKSFDELDKLSRQARILQLINSLTKLRLGNLGLVSCRGLEDLPLRHLVRIHLAHNRISQIAGFQNMPSLEFLNLSFNLLTSVQSIGLLLKLRALDVSFNLIQSIGAGALPNSLRFLVTKGNPLEAMKTSAWVSLFHYKPLILSHDTIPVAQFLERFAHTGRSSTPADAATAAGGSAGYETDRHVGTPLDDTPRCASRPVRFTPRSHTPRLLSPQHPPAHGRAAGSPLALTHHTHPLKAAVPRLKTRRYFRNQTRCVEDHLPGAPPQRGLAAAGTGKRADGVVVEQDVAGGEWVHACARSPEPGGSVDWRSAWGDSREEQGASAGADAAEDGDGVGEAAAGDGVEHSSSGEQSQIAHAPAAHGRRGDGGADERHSLEGDEVGGEGANSAQAATVSAAVEAARAGRSPPVLQEDSRQGRPVPTAGGRGAHYGAAPASAQTGAKRARMACDKVAGEGTSEALRVTTVDDPDLGLMQVCIAHKKCVECCVRYRSSSSLVASPSCACDGVLRAFSWFLLPGGVSIPRQSAGRCWWGHRMISMCVVVYVRACVRACVRV
jgi:hypothetical protein